MEWPGGGRIPLALAALAILLAGRVVAATFQAYNEGDRLQADVVTPQALEVVDPQRTEQARREAAARIPPIYRFETTMADQAESDLRREFDRKRRAFLQAMEQAARRPRLDEATVRHPSFARFVDWFRQQHPDFRVPDELARRWALHESDTAMVNGWVAELRAAMSRCIGDDRAIGSGPVRVVPAPALQSRVNEKLVERNGVNLDAAEFFTLEEVRETLRSDLAQTDPELGLMLQRFLRENCFLEEALTEKARLAAVTEVLALDRYEAGEIIARRGEVVDARIKAALDLLRSHAGSASASAETLEGPGRWAWRDWVWSKPWADPVRFEKLALLSLAALALVSVLGAMGAARMVRRKRRRQGRRSPGRAAARGGETEYTVVMNPQRNETIFLPMPETENAGSTAETSVGGGEAPVTRAAAEQFWQQRAFEAERRAEEILGMVRAGLAPQLARQMMHRLVQELVSQRAQWLQTQRLAESDLAAIEQRFLESHRQLQARLGAFEQRAVELEKALARKAEENSELIKAHISLTQQQLKAKQQQELHWN